MWNKKDPHQYSYYDRDTNYRLGSLCYDRLYKLWRFKRTGMTVTAHTWVRLDDAKRELERIFEGTSDE